MTSPIADIVQALPGDLLAGIGWTLAATAAGAVSTPDALPPSLEWLEAAVPGTVAQTLRQHGRWSIDAPSPLHDRDYWYRCTFPGAGATRLCFDGLATIAEVFLNGTLIFTSRNMFIPRTVEVTLAGCNELHVCLRSLDAALAIAPSRPRPRWRPRMIAAQNLRAIRSTLIGHMPGWCPPVHAIGPWRAVRAIPAAHQAVIKKRVTTAIDGRDGVIDVELRLAQTCVSAPTLCCSGIEVALHQSGERTWAGRLTVPDVRPWWPHTHGTPYLYALHLTCDGNALPLGRTGFRSAAIDRGSDGQGFQLRINDTPVFCRGAVWTSADVVALSGDRNTYEPALNAMREAGLNMVRVPGTMVYEADAFHQLCDELGILVWQDFMFANMDYPEQSEQFRAEIADEAAAFLARTALSPSLAVLCGGSEVAQQATMLGYPPAAAANVIFTEVLPAVAASLRPDVPYVVNSPSGGALPFSVGSGVAHYFGVGAYLRPLDDARRANVRFASECLAFAAIPEPATLERDLPVAAVHHPQWKARTPRDAGASWDFEDVRDHYLELVYGIDPRRLRIEDPDTYLYASRAVLAEVFETVLAEWRRPQSPTAGALVLTLQDMWAGAGWGLLDSRAQPKSTWYAMRRASTPLGLALTDEGLDGPACHVFNESDVERHFELRLRCLRDGKTAVVDVSCSLYVPPRGARTLASSEIIGSFFDITAAYRFGPPSHDVTIVSLHSAADSSPIAQAFHLPAMKLTGLAELGLRTELGRDGDAWHLTVISDRFARRVFIDDRNFCPSDNYFQLDPAMPRRICLVPRPGAAPTQKPCGEVHALNGRDVARFGGSR